MRLTNTLQGHYSDSDSRVYLSFWLDSIGHVADYDELGFNLQPLATGFELAVDQYSYEFMAGKTVKMEVGVLRNKADTLNLPNVVSVTIDTDEDFAEYLACRQRENAVSQ